MELGADEDFAKDVGELVEDVPDGIGAKELAAEAERVQGAAGLMHRKLELRDEAGGARRRLGRANNTQPIVIKN